MAAAMWACAAVALSSAREWEQASCAVVAVAFAVVTLVSACAALVVARRRDGHGVGGLGRARRTAAVVVLACFAAASLGLSCAAAQALCLHAQEQELASSTSSHHVVRVVEDPVEGRFGASCLAKDVESSALLRVGLPKGFDAACGDVVEVVGKAHAPSTRSAESSWSKGCVGSLNARSAEALPVSGVAGAVGKARQKAVELFSSRETGDASDLMCALVCGWRSDLLKSDLYEEVKAAGLAHLVAVSGSHLVLMTGMVAWGMGLLRAPKRASVVVQACFIGLYTLFTGAPISAVRAAVMAVCALLSFFAKRRAARANALGLCVMGMIVADTQCALSTSFVLSALATCGIVLLSRYASAWCRAAVPCLPHALCDVVGMTVSANALTMPVSVSRFGQLSLVSPLSNVVAGPLFTAMCALGGAAALVRLLAVAVPLLGVMNPLASGLAALSCEVAQLFVEVVHALVGLPAACVPATGDLLVLVLVAGALLVVLLVAWPRPSARRAWGMSCASLAALAAVLLVPGALAGEQVVAIDVGQGDAVLVRDGSRAVLVDTGEEGSGVVAGLARAHVVHLDAVVVTHHDTDHCGALSQVLRAVPVDQVCVAAGVEECPCASCRALLSRARSAHVVPLSKGDVVKAGRVECEVLSPDGLVEEGGNKDSLVLHARFGSGGGPAGGGTCLGRALLTGDAEADVVGPLVQFADVRGVDVLKVGHHGSKASLDDELAEALCPSVGLVSVGEGNRYGHPAPETVRRLEEAGATVMRTDESGDVACTFEEEGVRVRAQHEARR